MTFRDINPFHELYVTETAQPREFVHLFCPILVDYAHLLFQQGHVVLRGTQGCGKSMLLNLLKPQVRNAYYEENTEFPVPKEFADFIGAGINLTRSGVLDIGQRPVINNDRANELRVFPLYFADLLNYWIVRDILRTVAYMAQKPNVFNNIVNAKYLDEFSHMLSVDECWSGYIEHQRDFYSMVGVLVLNCISSG